MFRTLTLSLLALGLATGAIADTKSEAFVRNATYEMEKRTGEDQSRIIVDQIDVSKMAGFVLGEYGRNLPTADRVAFESRFEDFLVSVLAERAWQLSGADITVIGSVDRSDMESIVTTRVKSRAQPSTRMRWRLIREGDSWKAIDVQVGGLWLAIEQRAQVDIAMSYDDVDVGDLYDVYGGGQDELLAASTRNSGGGRRMVLFLDRVL